MDNRTDSEAKAVRPSTEPRASPQGHCPTWLLLVPPLPLVLPLGLPRSRSRSASPRALTLVLVHLPASPTPSPNLRSPSPRSPPHFLLLSASSVLDLPCTELTATMGLANGASKGLARSRWRWSQGLRVLTGEENGCGLVAIEGRNPGSLRAGTEGLSRREDVCQIY